MKILLMTGVALFLASIPLFASAETRAESAKCSEIGIFAKYVQADKMYGDSKKTAYQDALKQTKRSSEYQYVQISKHKEKSLLKNIYKEHDPRTTRYLTGNHDLTKYSSKCEKQFSHKEIASSSAASARPAWISRCLQIKRVEHKIAYMEEMNLTPHKAYVKAMNITNPFSNWHISSRYAKRLVNLTFFNPQWEQQANEASGLIGESLFHGCMQAHQNKVRGYHPLK